MPAACSRRDHGAELVARGRAPAGVARLGAEEADRVVAPVVAQARADQPLLVEVLLHRQQADRGDAQPLAGARSRRRCASPA
jgi:hypothetical protein